jgi:hypothetical protein
MFVTFPSYEYDVPPELRQSGETRWRVLDMTGPGFFVAVLSLPGDDSDAKRTVCFNWDSDLVHMVESPKIRAVLHSVHYLAPSDGSAKPFEIRSVRQIWRGVDRDAGDCEVIIFETTANTGFCGPEAIPVPRSVAKTSLIATVASPPTIG